MHVSSRPFRPLAASEGAVVEVKTKEKLSLKRSILSISTKSFRQEIKRPTKEANEIPVVKLETVPKTNSMGKLINAVVSKKNPLNTSASTKDMGLGVDEELNLRYSRLEIQQSKISTNGSKNATLAEFTSVEPEKAQAKIDAFISRELIDQKNIDSQSAAICKLVEEIIPDSPNLKKLKELVSANQDKINDLCEKGWKGKTDEIGRSMRSNGYEDLRSDLVMTTGAVLKDLSVALGHEKPYQFFSDGTPGYKSDIDVACAGFKMDQKTQGFFHAAANALIMHNVKSDKPDAVVKTPGFTLDTEFYTQHTDLARPVKLETNEGKKAVSRTNTDALLFSAMNQRRGLQITPEGQAAFKKSWDVYKQNKLKTCHNSERAALEAGFKDIATVKNQVEKGIIRTLNEGNYSKDDPHAEVKAKMQFRSALLPQLSAEMDKQMEVANDPKTTPEERDQAETKVKRLDLLRNFLYDEGYLSGNTLAVVLKSNMGQSIQRRIEEHRSIVAKELQEQRKLLQGKEIGWLAGYTTVSVASATPDKLLSALDENVEMHGSAESGHFKTKADHKYEELVEEHKTPLDDKTKTKFKEEANQYSLIENSKYSQRIINCAGSLLGTIAKENPKAVPHLEALQSEYKELKTKADELELLKRGKILPRASFEAELRAHFNAKGKKGSKLEEKIRICGQRADEIYAKCANDESILPETQYAMLLSVLDEVGFIQKKGLFREDGVILNTDGLAISRDKNLHTILQARCGISDENSPNVDKCLDRAHNDKPTLDAYQLRTSEQIANFNQKLENFAIKVHNATIDAATNPPSNAVGLSTISTPSVDTEFVSPLKGLLHTAIETTWPS